MFYTLNIFALHALYGKKTISFNLGSAMDLAQGFEDIVLETSDEPRIMFRENMWSFLKVVDDSSATNLQPNDLESMQSEYSLSNMLTAYRRIKQEPTFNNPPSSHKFGFVTNRKSLLENAEVTVGNIRCTIEPDRLRFGDALYLDEEQGKKYKLKPKSSDDFDNFFNEFYFVTDYPDNEELERAIKDALLRFRVVTVHNLDLAYGAFMTPLFDAMSSIPARFYTKDDIRDVIQLLEAAFPVRPAAYDFQ